MKEFPKDIKFKYSWRKYQQRVLDELQNHLTDKHLHVVAPPGSGKTILGLEVALRINKPTLILAPTIAIRNQWIQRFCELFLQTTQTPDWISRDIRNPQFMTVVTYQGLHSACNNLRHEENDEENEDETELNENGKNKYDNKEVRFVNSTLGKILRHKGVDTKQIIPQLKQIFDNSIPILSESEQEKEGHKQHTNFKGYHHYLGKVMIDEKEKYVRFTVQEKDARPETLRKGFVPNEAHSTFISDVEIYNANPTVHTSIIPKATNIGDGVTDTKLQEFFKSAREAKENSSKVTDANGEPLQVWHTTNADITEFNHKKTSKGLFGFFFSPNKERLSVYAKSKLMPVFLNIKNPIPSGTFAHTQEKLKEYQNKGYDGTMDWGHSKNKSVESLYEIIAFSPNQIKSATNNVGTYSNETNDIRFQLAEAVEKGDTKEIKKSFFKINEDDRNIVKGFKRNFFANAGFDRNTGETIRRHLGTKNAITDVSDAYISRFNGIVERDIIKSSDTAKQRWNQALETGINLVEEIKIPFADEREYSAVKTIYLNKTIAYLMATLGSGLLGFGYGILEGFGRVARNIKTIQDLYMFLAILGSIGMLIFGRQTYKTLRLYLKYRDISKDIQQIGDALLNSLFKAGVILSDFSKLKVETSIDGWGAIYCHLDGGTTFEKSAFINALQEIIAPIDNPRYVIIRKNRFMIFVKQKDYHSVPEMLGKNKNLAEYFKNQWERLVGACDLIFTRTIEGHKLLLKSRIESLSAQFEDKTERVNKWR